MKFLRSLLLLIGRLCIAAPFLSGGIEKLLNFDQASQYMASKGLSYIPILLIGAIIVEIFGSLLIIFGYKTRFGATILLLFLIPTTLLFHDFWNVDGTDVTMLKIMFFKNLAIIGGLLYMICQGAGGISCDAFRHRYHPEKFEPKQEPKLEPK